MQKPVPLSQPLVTQASCLTFLESHWSSIKPFIGDCWSFALSLPSCETASRASNPHRLKRVPAMTSISECMVTITQRQQSSCLLDCWVVHLCCLDLEPKVHHRSNVPIVLSASVGRNRPLPADTLQAACWLTIACIPTSGTSRTDTWMSARTRIVDMVLATALSRCSSNQQVTIACPVQD